MPIPTDSPTYRDLSDWIVVTILDAIRNGTIAYGERLVERDISKQLTVSRAPVRDALHKLETLGVVERREPRGVYVKTWTNEDVAEVVLLLEALGRLSVQRAAKLIDEAAIMKLEQILEETRVIIEQGSDDVAELMNLDHRFHHIIAQASNLGRVVQLMENLSLAIQLWQPEFLVVMGGSSSSLHRHEELLEALKRGNPDEAIACARRHGQEVERLIISYLAQPAEAADGPSPVSALSDS